MSSSLTLNFILLILCLRYIIKGHEIEIPIDYSNSTLNLISLLQNRQTIFLDIADGVDPYYKNMILKGNKQEQSFIIINEFRDSNKYKTLVKELHSQSNVLFVLEHLDANILNLSIVKRVLSNKWSVVCIILTAKFDDFDCRKKIEENKLYMYIEKFVNTLWHQFVTINIVIWLPLVCKDLYITYGEKKETAQGALYDRTITFKKWEDIELTSKLNPAALTVNYPLRASIFYRFPTSIQECEPLKDFMVLDTTKSGGFCGVDAMVMADIVSHLKLNLSIVPGNSFYGYLTSNGSVIGSLGTVVRHEVDISFNARFLADYKVGYEVDFLHYVTPDELCAVTKIANEKPIWLFPYDLFGIYMWSITMTVLITVGLFEWCTSKFLNHGLKNLVSARLKSKVQDFILDSLMTGLFGISITKKVRIFILKASCFFCAIVLTSIFQGHVNYAYTTTIRYHQIDTLQELYDSEFIINISPGILKLIEPPYNDMHEALYKRMITTEGLDGVIKAILNKTLHSNNYAGVERRTDVTLNTMKFYTDSEGNPLLHVLEECFRAYYLSYIASKHFPFIEEIRVMMAHMVEAGLPAQYYTWSWRAIGLKDVNKHLKTSQPRPTAPLRLQDLRIAFILLVMGHILSFICLLIEIKATRKHKLQISAPLA